MGELRSVECVGIAVQGEVIGDVTGVVVLGGVMVWDVVGAVGFIMTIRGETGGSGVLF